MKFEGIRSFSPLVAVWCLVTTAAGCSNDEDIRRKCRNTNQCAENESCEEGYCSPACIPGVDCPEKDGVSEGDSDGSGANDGDASSENDGLVESDIGTDTSSDTGPDVTPEVLACEAERSLLTFGGGTSVEVRFGEKSTGRIDLEDGWVVDPTCCGAGCCQ